MFGRKKIVALEAEVKVLRDCAELSIKIENDLLDSFERNESVIKVLSSNIVELSEQNRMLRELLCVSIVDETTSRKMEFDANKKRK